MRKEYYYRLLYFIAAIFLIPGILHAQTTDLSQLTAKGVAIYGWHSGVPTVLYSKQSNYLFPVASITKLVTAKVVEQLYPENSTVTISPQALVNIEENNNQLLPGMVFSRDDLLRAMLVSSDNAAANQFAQSTGSETFLADMNAFLHANGYTQTNFINPSGLDPATKKIKPNRLTAKNASYLLSSIFSGDPLLTSILETKGVIIKDQASGKSLQLVSSNALNNDPLYNFYIILSKTGTTDLAGQNLAFVANGEGKYDYVTVVFLHSKDRDADGKVILDWLQKTLQ